MFERAELLAPDGEAAVAAGHTLMLAGLLLLTLRRHDDALGLRAGVIVTAGGPDMSGALAALAADHEDDALQCRRLLALAILFAHGMPIGFPAPVASA